MARKRKALHQDDVVGGARKLFVGVRQRPSGRWMAEIKDTIQKIRVWLGTFGTTEEAARAYDEAACLVRGAHTRTNFWPTSPHSSPALPSKITNLLLSRLKARNNNSNSPPPLPLPPGIDQNQGNHNQNQCQPDFSDFDLYEDFGLENFSRLTGDHHDCSVIDGGQCHEMTTGRWDFSENTGVPEEGSATALEDVDFEFVDGVGWPTGYSAFEIAEEMAEAEAGEEAVMMSEAMKRMSYKRKFSASLYAFNGITECLNLRLNEPSVVEHRLGNDRVFYI